MSQEAAAGISGGLGLAGSLVSGLFASRENKKQRQWNEKMYNLSVENNRQDALQAHEWQKELQQLAVDEMLRGKRESWSAEVEGLRAAGLNPMLALNGGVTGSGGIGAPSSAQANPAHAGSPGMMGMDTSGFNTAAQAVQQAAVMKSQAELNSAKADEIRGETAPVQKTMEQQEAQIQEINGKINLMLTQQGLIKAQTANQDANTKWQNIQNDIAKATEREQMEIIRWQLYGLRKDYEIAIQDVMAKKIENKVKLEYLESQINLFNMQANLMLSQRNLAETQNETEKGRDAYMEKQNMLLYLQLPSLVDMSKWQAKNEQEFRDRYEEALRVQRQGQNKQLAGQIIGGLLGAAGGFFKGKAIMDQMSVPKTTEYGGFDSHGDWIRTSWKRESNNGLGL